MLFKFIKCPCYKYPSIHWEHLRNYTNRSTHLWNNPSRQRTPTQDRNIQTVPNELPQFQRQGEKIPGQCAPIYHNCMRYFTAPRQRKNGQRAFIRPRSASYTVCAVQQCYLSARAGGTWGTPLLAADYPHISNQYERYHGALVHRCTSHLRCEMLRHELRQWSRSRSTQRTSPTLLLLLQVAMLLRAGTLIIRYMGYMRARGCCARGQDRIIAIE